MCALSQDYQRCARPCAASCWSAPELGLTGDTVLPVLPIMQAPPRCSRSVQPSLLIARADPDPDNLRGACWLQSWVETAARTCLWAACGLPATTALPAAGALLRCALLVALCARALLQQPHPCSGSAQSSMPSGDASDRCHTRAMAGGVLCAGRCGMCRATASVVNHARMCG